MFGLPLRAFVILMFAVALTACGTRPKPAPEELQVYDIRGATVAAKPGIPVALIRGIKMRLDRSIHDTVRPDALAPAIMNVAVMGVTSSLDVTACRTLSVQRRRREPFIARPQRPSARRLAQR